LELAAVEHGPTIHLPANQAGLFDKPGTLPAGQQRQSAAETRTTTTSHPRPNRVARAATAQLATSPDSEATPRPARARRWGLSRDPARPIGEDLHCLAQAAGASASRPAAQPYAYIYARKHGGSAHQGPACSINGGRHPNCDLPALGCGPPRQRLGSARLSPIRTCSSSPGLRRDTACRGDGQACSVDPEVQAHPGLRSTPSPRTLRQAVSSEPPLTPQLPVIRPGSRASLGHLSRRQRRQPPTAQERRLLQHARLGRTRLPGLHGHNPMTRMDLGTPTSASPPFDGSPGSRSSSGRRPCRTSESGLIAAPRAAAESDMGRPGARSQGQAARKPELIGPAAGQSNPAPPGIGAGTLRRSPGRRRVPTRAAREPELVWPAAARPDPPTSVSGKSIRPPQACGVRFLMRATR
jgi:hypothetical protein